MADKSIRALKDTFWNRKRVEANIPVRELADAMDTKYSTMAGYLIGKNVPSADLINKMCNWFGVDPIEGEREFIKAHKVYDAKRKGNSVIAKYSKKVKEEPEKEEKAEEPVTKTVMSNAEKLDAIARLLYKKVSYEEFCSLGKMSFDKILEIAYDRVDYATFRLIESIINDKIVRVEDGWSV